jgi:hypothetical protein
MAGVRAVKIDSGNGYVRFTADESSSPPEYVAAELHADGLSATSEVIRHYANGFQDLVDFFRELASDWRGWTGVREWESPRR